jgi:tetratricopeptide (TPR) repeat protein
MTRNEKWILFVLLTGGLLLRLVHIFEMRGDILFNHPVVDEPIYIQDARALIHGGNPTLDGPYWQPPGIVYALAVIFRLLGEGLLWPRVIQALLSTACAWLVFAVGRRFFSTKMALGAAAAVALHGAFIFASSELLPPVWIAFFDLAALLLLARAHERKSRLSALAAGLLIGISAILTPIVLIFVPVAMISLSIGATWRQRLAICASFFLGIAAVVAPVTLRNYRISHQLVLVSTNGGVNFFIGNNDDYQSTLSIRPGPHWQGLVDDEPERLGFKSATQKSAYFYRRAFSFMKEHPFKAASLEFRKLYLYLNGAEIPRDTDIYSARERSVVLKLLVWPRPLLFPSGVIIPLALIGIGATISQFRRRFLLFGFLIVQVVVVSSFFVTSRYRLPAIPVFSLFAVQGAAWLYEAMRARDRRRMLPGIALLVGLTLFLNLPTREAAASYRAEADYYRGLASMEMRRPGAAVEYFSRSIKEDPKDSRSYYSLGVAQYALHQTDLAIQSWRRATEVDPWDILSRRRIGLVLAQQGGIDEAIGEFQATIADGRRDPKEYAPEYFNIAQLRVKKKELSKAIEGFTVACRLNREFCQLQAQASLGSMEQDLREGTPAPDFWIRLGDILDAAGSRDGALQAWRHAGDLEPADAQIRQEVDERLARYGDAAR